MDDGRRMNLAFDFGDGRQADVEFNGSDRLWLAVGPGLPLIDFWIKEGGQLIDLRVRVRRTPKGISISVDRGDDDEKAWWNKDSAPSLTIAIDDASGAASATASVGIGPDFQQVLLGEIAI